MIPQTEQLAEQAHELALTHRPYTSRTAARRLWKAAEADARSLESFLQELGDRPGACSQPVEEWLLDHAEFLQEQALLIREQIKEAFPRGLVGLRGSGQPRILSVCSEYLKLADGCLDQKSFVEYLHAYQEVSVLTLAEIRAIPLILRIALLRQLTEVTEMIRERRTICASIERMLAGLDASDMSPEGLQAALREEGRQIPLSGPFVAHLVHHLRERAEEPGSVREWLVCNLDSEAESLDDLVTYEYRLQTSYQMTTGHIIGSLRGLSRWDWREEFEQVCLVERILNDEPTGDYALMDGASREVLRGKVERLARRLRVPENLVARKAVELASERYGQAAEGDLPPRRHLCRVLSAGGRRD